MMSNRIANLCLTNLCRRNISTTALSLQRKKKFTKAQVGFENLEKPCRHIGQLNYVPRLTAVQSDFKFFKSLL